MNDSWRIIAEICNSEVSPVKRVYALINYFEGTVNSECSCFKTDVVIEISKDSFICVISYEFEGDLT